MTANIAKCREEIFDVIDDCENRCVGWTEQFRRVEKVLTKFAAEVRESALEEAAVVCDCQSAAIYNADPPNAIEEAETNLQAFAGQAVDVCGEAVRALKTPPLPQPNVPLGNNPAPEVKP